MVAFWDPRILTAEDIVSAEKKALTVKLFFFLSQLLDRQSNGWDTVC